MGALTPIPPSSSLTTSGFTTSEIITAFSNSLVKVAEAGLVALRSQLPKFFQPEPRKPLIELVVKHTVLGPGFTSTSISHKMSYDFCNQGLKEGDWEAMTDQERSDLKHYYSTVDCKGVTKKLSSEITQAFQEVAKKMRAGNAEQLSFKQIDRHDFFQSLFGKNQT